jgi:histidine triad (HIT) family protein
VSERGECIFCRIVDGDIPATVVAESERTVAFRDLNPQAPTHVLVIPRDHVDSAATVGPEHADAVAELLVTARRVAEAEGILDGGYRLVFNVGDDSGNTVPHLHLHVLGGRSMPWPPWAGASAAGAQ